MTTNTIYLESFRTPGAKVFTGRDRGIEVRSKSKIDELIKSSDKITIVIPNEIRSINPSFLEEFLKNVVNELKEDGFRKKFNFEVSSDRYDRESFEVDLTEAIERILREETALA